MITEDFMSFECYCVEIENIPYYNFLSEREYDAAYERYEKYLEDKGFSC